MVISMVTKTLEKRMEDKMVIISAGVTLHESIKAYEKLS